MQLASQTRRAGSEDLAVDLRGADRFAVPESRAAVCGRGDALPLPRPMTAREDRQRPALAVRCAFSCCRGAARAFDMHRYNSRRSALTADEAARWEVRYQIGAMIYAAALGLWCYDRAVRQRRRRRPHDLPVRHHRLRGGRCGPDLWTAVDIPRADCTRLRSDGACAGACVARPITSAWRSSARCFSWR